MAVSVNEQHKELIEGQAMEKPGCAPAKRIGLLTMISADCDTVPVMNAKARRYHELAFEVLAELGFQPIRLPEPTRTSQEAVAHIRQLEDAGAEALVFNIADWSYSTTAAIGALAGLLVL